MSEARIAFAPSSDSSSITRFESLRRTIARRRATGLADPRRSSPADPKAPLRADHRQAAHSPDFSATNAVMPAPTVFRDRTYGMTARPMGWDMDYHVLVLSATNC